MFFVFRRPLIIRRETTKTVRLIKERRRRRSINEPNVFFFFWSCVREIDAPTTKTRSLSRRIFCPKNGARFFVYEPTPTRVLTAVFYGTVKCQRRRTNRDWDPRSPLAT